MALYPIRFPLHTLPHFEVFFGELACPTAVVPSWPKRKNPHSDTGTYQAQSRSTAMRAPNGEQDTGFRRISSPNRAKVKLVVQDNTWEGIVNVEFAVVLWMKLQFLEFIHEKIDPGARCPDHFASVSCDTLGNHFLSLTCCLP